MTLTPLMSLTTSIARPLLVAGAAAILVGAGVGAGIVLATASPPSTCRLPDGVELDDLGAHDRSFSVRRLLLCGDLEHGRITLETYRAQISALDAAWSTPPARPASPPPIQWASTVLGVSTQYTSSSWAASEALGPPDVYPSIGDQAHAWASLGADDRAEWIHLGYTQPTPINAVEIYETFNPGAVDRVELITTSGQTITVHAGPAHPSTLAKHRIEIPCTAEPIASVRIHLDSQAVPGWNEIDAVAIQPCP